MKKTLLLFFSLSVFIPVFAQNKLQSRNNPDLYGQLNDLCRKEIIIPDVDGFKAVKTDLHCHSIYSDAHIDPEYRVKEAWYDGLDVLAMTDHIEYIPGSKKMAKFVYASDPEKNVDFNHSSDIAVKEARKYGISVIRGLEITRNVDRIGHFCLLFTKDNNKIPDEDPIVSMKNALAQGALIQYNHPGWNRRDANLTPIAKKALEAGYIHGVEVFNGVEFYPKCLEYAEKYSLFVAGNTDSHEPTAFSFRVQDSFRNMTIVFAKDSSEESLREALLARRTVAYCFGDLAGSEELLVKMFEASVSCKLINIDSKGKKRFQITNHSSLPYLIHVEGVDSKSADLPVKLGAFSSAIVRVKKDADLTFSIENMWCGIDKHPVISKKL